MTHRWIDPSGCETLAFLVESVAGPLLVEHQSPVCLELDIDVQLHVPADPTRTSDLLESLIRQALEEMPDGGDLTITATSTASGIELELADTGRDITSRPQSRPLAAAAIGVDLTWQNCPQGGGCVTIKFFANEQRQRLAA